MIKLIGAVITHSTCNHKHLLSHKQGSHTAPAISSYTNMCYYTRTDHTAPAITNTCYHTQHLHPQTLAITQAVITHSTCNHNHLVSHTASATTWYDTSCDHAPATTTTLYHTGSGHTQHQQPQILGIKQAVITQHLQPLGVSQAVITQHLQPLGVSQ